MRAMEYTPVQCRCQPIGQWTLVLTCLIHGPQVEPTKKLTDAECAAERWRAEADRLYSHPAVESWSARPIDIISREHIWYRFARYPHASEVDQ